MTKKRKPSDDLIDQSKLLKKRANRRIEESRQRIDRNDHRWLAVVQGRICQVCRTVQVEGEYEDSACGS